MELQRLSLKLIRFSSSSHHKAREGSGQHGADESQLPLGTQALHFFTATSISITVTSPTHRKKPTTLIKNITSNAF